MSITVGSTLASQIGVVVILARVFGVEGLGTYAYHFAIASFFGLVSTFGFPVYLQRELSANLDAFDTIHNDALSLKVILDVFLLIGAVALSCAYELPEVWLFFQLLIARILFAYTTFFLVEFRVLEAFQLESSLTAAGNLLYFLGVVIVAFAAESLVLVGTVLLAIRFLTLLFVLQVWTGRRRRSLLQFRIDNLWATLRKNLPYAIDQGVSEFMMHAVTFAVGFLLGTSALGIFQAGMRFVGGLLTLASVIMGAFVSNMSLWWSTNRKAFLREARRASYLLHGIGVGGFALLLFGGEMISKVFLGSEFIALNDLWPQFAAYLGLRYFAATPGIILVAAGRQKVRVVINLAMLTILLCLLPIALRWEGISGAIALMIAVTFTSLFLYYFVILKHRIIQSDEKNLDEA